MNLSEWIITKSKSGIFSTGTTYLDTDTFPVIVTESSFSLLSLGRYLSPLTTLTRCISRGSNRNFMFAISFEILTNTSHGALLLTILLLDFVIIHWIQWIQQKSFWENSSLLSLELLINSLICTFLWLKETLNNKDTFL